MAKDLPFFQFEPAEYLTGDIAFCSLSAQGLFINICSYYWQRKCNLSKGSALKRLNHPNELDELISDNILKVEDGMIRITFLDEQFEAATGSKKESSEKGKLGNLKRWHKDLYNKVIKNEITLVDALLIANSSGGESGGDNLAIAKTSHIREDNIREEKMIIENSEKKEISTANNDNNYQLHIDRAKIGNELPNLECARRLCREPTERIAKEAILIKFKIIPAMEEFLDYLVNEFITHRNSTGKLTATMHEFREHLNNWLPKCNIEEKKIEYFKLKNKQNLKL